MRWKLFCLIMITIVALSACSETERDASQDKKIYDKAVSNFYVSLAAIQTDQAPFAFSKMNEVAKAYPKEPAAWANLGVFAMRQGNYELATEQLQKALNLAPKNPDILFLAAILERNRRNVEESISYLNQVLQADSTYSKAQFMLANQLEQLDFNENREEITQQLTHLAERHPQNQALLLELIRTEAKKGNLEKAGDYLEQLGSLSGQWSSSTVEQFEQVQNIIAQENTGELNLQLALLRNQLQANPLFQHDIRQLALPDNQVGFLIQEFIYLEQPKVKTAPPDSSLRFSQQPAKGIAEELVNGITSLVLNESTPPLLAAFIGENVAIDTADTISFPGANTSELPNNALASLDYNYDFKNDIALAGDAGFKLYQQQENLQFSDVTESLALPPSITNARYNHVWSADLDVDGDLDILLTRDNGKQLVLRNNGDNTFEPMADYFPGISGTVQFIWGDLDSDLDPDGLFLSKNGELTVLINERGNNFEPVDDLPAAGNIRAVALADIDANSRFDVIALNGDGSLIQLFKDQSDEQWKQQVLADNINLASNSGNARLHVQDIDNNGRLDITLSAGDETQLFLGSEENQFSLFEHTLSADIQSIVDMDGDQRLDFVGISPDGAPVQFVNSGDTSYHARSIRTRASDTSGDRRINSFAIGGQLEIRSGLLYQKQPIASPIVHFGLGKYEDTDMLRIIWPNGSVQAEFAELGIGSTIFNKQLLKGSCPWLFTYNEGEFEFVTDILWRSPLGLRINAQETAGVVQTKDRVRIPGEKLSPRDGVYDLRITAELWETHFFDEVKVVAVDHPVGTEIFLDERFAIPPPDLKTRLMKTPQPVERVSDGQGTDQTDKIRAIDETYLHAFEQTKFQGVVDEHSITIELGDEAPANAPLWLIAYGWVKPTDSSVNYALSQGKNPFPKGLQIEVASGNQSWKTYKSNYGFPAGKTKTVLVDLTDVFDSAENRRVKFTTTTEIYWDAIQWAEGLPETDLATQPLQPVEMNLAYRGYSEWNKASRYHPLLPNYNQLSGTTPIWQDLVGYYTRFGPVDELLKSVDDRYVIMNAGDELRLRFKALPKPKDGYERDFILVSDGWIKDGDLNTKYSKTVWPLPSHQRKDYEADYERLMDDPVYQKHKKDWIKYHTRFITPSRFQHSLISITP